jgi:hypothetical protein
MDETDPVGSAEIFRVRRQQCGGQQMPKAEFRREVEKQLTGKDSKTSELIYFKAYKSQIPVIEQAIETEALMLGTDKYRGYCLGGRVSARPCDSDWTQRAVANCIGRCWSATAGEARFGVCKTYRHIISNSAASQVAIWNRT